MTARGDSLTRAILWTARVTSLIVLIPVLMILFWEDNGTGSLAPSTTIYLALFPIGFSLSYLAAWRWPLIGGWASISCMLLSLVVTGVIFPAAAYVSWGVLCIPGILFCIAGLRMNRGR